jgi:3-phenylpropionate/trans-cinnamate dioxygenase ferredoxin subunit
MANYKWYKIADAVEEIHFGENNIAVAEADGKTICVAKHKDELFAFAYKCPHASGIMADGFIDVLGNIVCPVHRYKFCITNGRNVSGEGYYLKHWPVRIEDEKVYVGFEEKSFLKWP